jgi:two-component system, OmpR family, sensor kinase
MTETPRLGVAWQSIRNLPGRMPLRTKLISAVLALVAIALVVISVAGLSFLHSYLLGAADNQLYQVASRSRAAAAYSPEGFVTEILQNGKVVAWQGYVPPGMSVPDISSGAPWLTSGSPATVATTNGAGRWRVLAVPNQTLQNQFGQPVGTGTVVYGINVTSQYSTIGKLAVADVGVSIAIVLLLAIVATAAVRASLRPLVEIEQTAGAIAAGDLSRRVPERDPRTEVGRLGRSLNVMLSVIESAFHAQSTSEAAARRSEDKMRQFVADASHELRTPLTTIRSSAESYRQRGGIESGENGSGHLTSKDMDRTMRRIEQESARMGVLVADMLLLAQLDRQRPLQSSPVDLLTLAADAVHDAQVVAPDRSIHLSVGSGAALIVNGDEIRLRQVIGNLMTNALTHTPAGTPIDVLIRSGNLDEALPTTPEDRDAPRPAATHQPAAVLEVADHGPGLTKDQAEHVFERFYRGDRARAVGGTGLGLAIVAALVAGHGGATWVRSVPGEGATFCIALPLTPEAAEGPDEDDGAADLDDTNHDPTRLPGNPEEGTSGPGDHVSAFQEYWARLDSPAASRPISSLPLA